MSTSSENTITSDVPVCITQNFVKISMILRSQVWRDAEVCGLKATQAQVLSLLLTHQQSSLRVTQIAHFLGVSVPTASDTIATLAKKGFVLKKQSPKDKRMITLALTERGFKQANRLQKSSRQMTQAVAMLTSSEQESLNVILTNLLELLQQCSQK